MSQISWQFRQAVVKTPEAWKENPVNIGIIGSGNVGGTLGMAWAGRGHQILFSYSRDPKKLEGLVASAGPNASAGSPAEAAQFGEVIVLAVPWPAVDDALQAAGSLAGKILIDCTNPLTSDLSGMEIGHTTSAAEEIARRASGARVVKAFNSIGAANMANPVFGSQRATMFFCGTTRPPRPSSLGWWRRSALSRWMPAHWRSLGSSNRWPCYGFTSPTHVAWVRISLSS
jgi:8-hydroxy-5-deazaflavin:NADPH oxidoreductase